MITVVGRWELSWNTPIKEAELWNLVLRDFAVEDWHMFPVSGIHQRERDLNLYEHHTFDDVLEEVKDKGTLVYVEPSFPNPAPNHQSLPDFVHPDDAVYIFGSVGFNPCAMRKRDEDLALSIPTIENKGVPWPHQCLMVLLYDRMVKSWQSQ